MDQHRSNCIFLMADQLRYDVLGKGYTPNMDALIGDSIFFPNTYCASPLCVPARGALFTGTYPGINGSLINGWHLPEERYSKVKEGIDNLYQVMERLDMECIHSGKQHLFVEGIPLEKRPDTRTAWLATEETYRNFMREQGRRMPGGPDFRTWVPELADGVHSHVRSYSNPHTGCYEEGYDYYFDGYFTNAAVEALEKHRGEKPLFLSMMFLAPHPPFDIPQPWYRKVEEGDVSLPENVGAWYLYQSPLQKYNVTGYIGNPYGHDHWREAWRAYLGLVSLLDACVGRIVGTLKEKGLYEDSVIVLGSDHGEMLGSHRLFQKMCMYEESVRTPFSIRLPGGRHSGEVHEEVVSQIDIFPTICDLYGVAPAHCPDGVSLRRQMEGGGKGRERPVYIQYDGNASRGNFQRCVIWKGYKYIADMFKDEWYYELYDIKNDRQETKNLLFDRAEDGSFRHEAAAGEMNRLLREHLAGMGDFIRLPAWDLPKFVKDYED